MKIRKNTKSQNRQNVDAVERERERERERASLLSKEKIGVIILLVLIIVAVIVAVRNSDAIKKSMHFAKIDKARIGENASNETLGATAVDTSKWNMTRVNAVADTEGIYVPVPKGFVASGATGEHTVNTGFVIYEGDTPVDDSNAWNESCTRNQFVWVPVPDTTRVFEEIGQTGKKKAKLWEYSATGKSAIDNWDTDYRKEPGILSSKNFDNKKRLTRYGMQGYTREKLYQELSTSFDRDMESIKQYGGFYIGRYETGNVSSEQPVVKRMNTDIESQTWYEMYPRMKNISTNGNVEASMIWGCLWDETLQWFIDTQGKTQAEVGSDLSSWGNYSRTTFEYTNTNGGTSTKSSNAIIPTGSTERNKANNIYDMAGNVWDSTLEGNRSDARISRGGFYVNQGTANPVCYRTGGFSSNCGIRGHFIIK